MMRSLDKIIMVCIFFLLITSCNLSEEIKIDNIDIESHMVLNCMAYADRDTNFFYLTESKPIYRKVDSTLISTTPKNGFKLIKDANVSVKVNEDLHYLDYSKHDSAYILVKRLMANDRLSILAEDNNRRVEAVSTLTAKPEVISVDTATVYKMNEYYNGSGGYISNTTRKYLMFKVRIKDRPGSKDYFKLYVNSRYSSDKVGTYAMYGGYTTDDPVLINGNLGGTNDRDLGLASSPSNYLNIFRDRLFQDDEYTLKFYVEYLDRYYWNEDQDVDLYFNMTVKLEAISEDLYKYYSTLQYNMSIDGDNVSEPIVIFSNIEGGLGILGTSSSIEIFNHDFKID